MKKLDLGQICFVQDFQKFINGDLKILINCHYGIAASGRYLYIHVRKNEFITKAAY